MFCTVHKACRIGPTGSYWYPPQIWREGSGYGDVMYQVHWLEFCFKKVTENHSGFSFIDCWKCQFNGPTWCGMCPHTKAAAVYVRTRGRTQAMRMFSPPLFFFPSCILSLYTFLPVHNFPPVFRFHPVVTINHDLHLRLTKALYFYLSGSALLCKTLTVNHYLHSDYFQHRLVMELSGWINLMTRQALAMF